MMRVGNDGIIIDGFRNYSEVQEIRKTYPRFFLVAVCADKDERWNRVRKDYKGDYNEFEDDDRRDQNEVLSSHWEADQPKAERCM